MLRRSHKSSYSWTLFPARTLCLAGATYLQPKRSPLAHSRKLSGLEVREPKRGQVAILLRKVREAIDHNRKLLKEKRQSFTNEDQVCVAGEM